MPDRAYPNLIHLKTHPIVNLIVGKCYVILELRIPRTWYSQYDKVHSRNTKSEAYHFLS